MSKEIYTIDQIQGILDSVFKSYNIKKAVLFGSYNKKDANSESDIDILVDSGLKGLDFVGLIEDIRCAVDKDVDVFDVTHIEEGSLIDKEIQETGVLIYEK